MAEIQFFHVRYLHYWPLEIQHISIHCQLQIATVIDTTHWIRSIDSLIAKLFDWNFPPLKVVSRWRDPQLQVNENYSDLTKWKSTIFKYCWLVSCFIFNMFKRWYLMSYWKMKILIWSIESMNRLILYNPVIIEPNFNKSVPIIFFITLHTSFSTC